MLTRLIFASFFLIAVTVAAQDENSTDPGFIEGVFDSESIVDLLSRGNSDGIRFYNVMVDDTVRVMAVPIESKVDMNDRLLLFKPYTVAMGVVKNSITVDKMSEGKAADACATLDESEYAHYSTYYTKKDIETLLGQATCNALKIVPTVNSKTLSMTLHSVNFEAGKVTDIGQGEGYDLICSDPCPPVCGPASNYVYLPPR